MYRSLLIDMNAGRLQHFCNYPNVVKGAQYTDIDFLGSSILRYKIPYTTFNLTLSIIGIKFCSLEREITVQDRQLT